MVRKKTSLIPKSKAKTAYGLLSEVCALILDEPLRYDQSRFIARSKGAGGADSFTTSGKFPTCGTVGCVAGWIATLKHPKTFDYTDTEEIATRVLGRGLPTYDLFTGGVVKGQGQTRAHARAGVAHIRRFQKKHAAELKAKRV